MLFKLCSLWCLLQQPELTETPTFTTAVHCYSGVLVSVLRQETEVKGSKLERKKKNYLPSQMT